MSELFDKSIRTLELHRVLALLSDQAVSAEARERALRVRPETETCLLYTSNRRKKYCLTKES